MSRPDHEPSHSHSCADCGTSASVDEGRLLPEALAYLNAAHEGHATTETSR